MPTLKPGDKVKILSHFLYKVVGETGVIESQGKSVLGNEIWIVTVPSGSIGCMATDLEKVEE